MGGRSLGLGDAPLPGNFLGCGSVPNAALNRHLDYYNNRGPRRSMGMKTPAEQARIMGMAA